MFGIGLGVAFLIALALAASGSSKPASPGAAAAGLPPDLQAKLAQALAALTVGSDGKITGPITKEALQLATSVAGQIDAAGYHDAAEALRAYIRQAQALLAPVPPGQQIPVPSIPPDLQAMFNQALQTERDPKKLRAILAALQAIQPQTPDIQHAEQALEALIVQTEAQAAQAQAMTQIQQTLSNPAPPPPYTPPSQTSPGWQPAPPVMPGSTASTGTPGAVVTPQGTVVAPASVVSSPSGAHVRPTLSLKAKSYGDDVADWQRYLVRDGFPVAVDKQFGKGTDAATRKWQSQRGLASDGIVGPKSWAVAEGGQAIPVSVTQSAPAVTALPSAMPNLVTTPVPGLPPVAVPGASPQMMTPVQAAAQAMVMNMKAVQGSYGMPGGKGKEDKSLVQRFQALATGSSKPDGLAGPGTLLNAATQGQTDLPLVMYWPKSATQKDVISYRTGLLNLASQQQAAGNALGASQLAASAARERGQAGIVGPMPA
jgi:peptidoglycan hydrolase-like protein with peptidoglycan-binding domain